MKIGKLVKSHIKEIFFYCDNVQHGEIDNLLDPRYSKKTFGINFPFCIELANIEQSSQMRYWTEQYLVRGKAVRVTSQWIEARRPAFLDYLESKGITPKLDSAQHDINENQGIRKQLAQPPSNRSNRRYRGCHIGSAQNQFIRNILSSLGLESFTEVDWNSTKDYFSNKCAYCGAESELLEHAIPINKKKLGEHRLGNLVPSCGQCNEDKGGKDFREFLGENLAAISRIEEYMESRNYVPLEDNEQMKMILNMAHKEVAALADRYITIINELFSQSLDPSSVKKDQIAKLPIQASKIENF